MNKLNELIIAVTKDQKKEVNQPPDDDTHGFNDLLDIIDRSVNTNDYALPVKQAEPTCSMVDVHQVQLEQPDPEESKIQNISESEVIFNNSVSQNEDRL